MNRFFTTIAVAGLAIATAAPAHAAGWYNNTLTAAESTAAPFQPVYSSYQHFLTGPGGEFYSASVNSFAMNLGQGMSMELFSAMPNASAASLSAFPVMSGFASSRQTNYASGLYLDPAVAAPASAAGRLAVNLGGGLSFNLLGGLSRETAGGLYFGQASGFGNRMFTTAGAGLSMNFGHGGTFSLIGSMSRSVGPSCAFPSIAAC